jgi:hypothetical protein
MPVSSRCWGFARSAPRRRLPRQLGSTSRGTQPTCQLRGGSASRISASSVLHHRVEQRGLAIPDLRDRPLKRRLQTARQPITPFSSVRYLPSTSESSSQTPSTEGSVSSCGFRLVSGRGQAASFSRALALIIAAPFSAIMIVGAFVFVELTAGITEASMTRSASSPWTRDRRSNRSSGRNRAARRRSARSARAGFPP